VHARIAVSVGNIDLAFQSDSDISRAVERRPSALYRIEVLAVVARVRGRVFGAHRHEQLPLRRELANRVLAVIRAEDRAVRGDVDAVRAIGEVTLPPRALEVALSVVHHDGMIAAAHEVHAVFLVDGDAGDIAVIVALRQLLPSFDDGVFDLGRLFHAGPL
jgi:hypothetical protein